MGNITLQIIHKTYCCVNATDENIFNENLDEDTGDDNEDDN